MYTLLPFVALLFSSLDASMTCMDGYDPVYMSAIPGYQVLCCWSGVSNGKCHPSSPNDYYASCQAMFNLANGYQCNCGSLCSGEATRGFGGVISCEGTCSCPPISGCNNTMPISKAAPQEPTDSPTSGTTSMKPFAFGLVALIAMGFLTLM